MHYLTLLYDDPTTITGPGDPAFDADMEAFDRFGEIAGESIVGGEALEGPETAVSVRPGANAPLVTDGPFAETTEVLGGFFVLEAPDLDAAVELARQIPTTRTGGIELRPLVQWRDGSGVEPGDSGAGSAPRWLCTIHGPETVEDDPGSAAWEVGAAAHGDFAELAGDALIAAAALHPTTSATTLRERDGTLLLGDGPFAEVTEIVGGCYVLVGSRDEVIALVAQVPVHPDGGVELRQVMDLGADPGDADPSA